MPKANSQKPKAKEYVKRRKLTMFILWTKKTRD